MSSVKFNSNDIAIIYEIITVCSNRNVFLPEEYELVGKVYGKLQTFIKEHIGDKYKETKVNDNNIINNIVSNKSPSPDSQVESADDKSVQNVN